MSVICSVCAYILNVCVNVNSSVHVHQYICKLGRNHYFQVPGSQLIAKAREIATALRRRCKCSSQSKCTCTFRSQMTPKQSKRINKYSFRWKDRCTSKKLEIKSLMRFCHANDDPDARCVWSGLNGHIPTLRRCMGPIYCPNVKRPALPSELLMSMGWRPNDYLDTFPIDNAPKMQRLLGNAMHLGSVSSVIMIALACVKAPDI